jgi:hypothetical protein
MVYLQPLNEKRRCRSTAKFREETSKKAATRSRTAVAAVIKVGLSSRSCNHSDAPQQITKDVGGEENKIRSSRAPIAAPDRCPAEREVVHEPGHHAVGQRFSATSITGTRLLAELEAGSRDVAEEEKERPRQVVKRPRRAHRRRGGLRRFATR